MRHENDQQSVLSWINEWNNDSNNPITYYKLQGDKDETFDLEIDDFMLVIQTESQKYIYNLFANKGICCDSTHGTTGYDFTLTSLLVIDEYGEGIPVAWCISNHENFKFMKTFFHVIT